MIDVESLFCAGKFDSPVPALAVVARGRRWSSSSSAVRYEVGDGCVVSGEPLLDLISAILLHGFDCGGDGFVPGGPLLLGAYPADDVPRHRGDLKHHSGPGHRLARP